MILEMRLTIPRQRVNFLAVKTQEQKQTKQYLSRSGRSVSASPGRDAFRVMIALVCILFASLASREQDASSVQKNPKVLSQELADSQMKRLSRVRELKRSRKIPESPLLQHVNGSI